MLRIDEVTHGRATDLGVCQVGLTPHGDAELTPALARPARPAGGAQAHDFAQFGHSRDCLVVNRTNDPPPAIGEVEFQTGRHVRRRMNDEGRRTHANRRPG